METLLEKISKSAARFLIPLTAEDTYKVIVEEATKLVGAEHGTILLEHNGEMQRVYASWDLLYKVVPHRHANTYQTFTNRKSRLVYTHDLPNVKSYNKLRELGIKAMVYIPLSNRNQALGVLIVNTTGYLKASSETLHALDLFGSLASLAIRKTQLYEELKKALELRDLFVSLAAHELRTPLTAINGYAQLLSNRMDGKDVTLARWTNQLLWETTRLVDLVKELLETNRIRSGKLQYELKECRAIDILKRATNQFKFIHPDHSIELINNLENGRDAIIGDFDKLLQVAINILDNAAKFSPADKKIVITLKQKGGYVIMHFKDEGKGIEKEELPKLFEGFHKGKGSHAEGLGLGLFLAKNIIEKHRGEINIRSKINKGTLVEIKLPHAKHS